MEDKHAEADREQLLRRTRRLLENLETGAGATAAGGPETTAQDDVAPHPPPPDREEMLRQTRHLLQTLGAPSDETPGGVNADIWEVEKRLRRLEQLRSRQLSTTFRSGRG